MNFLEIAFSWLEVPWVIFSLLTVCVLVILTGLTGSGVTTQDRGIGFWATVFFLLSIVLVGHRFGLTLPLVLGNPMMVIPLLIAYSCIGILWSFARWGFYLSGVRRKFNGLLDEFMKTERMDTSFQSFIETTRQLERDIVPTDARKPSAVLEDYNNRMNRLVRFFSKVRSLLPTYESLSEEELLSGGETLMLQAIKPRAEKHKAMITEWALFWPVSMVWTILNDPLVTLVNYLFWRFRNLYQRMSDSAFSA